eukprot:GHRR01031418.1.p1 GENE.GHRR01031418.1~~GHRR01031418.1.p1  ORF type:complete len:134 (+),score=27.76 GHRR01031418.1:644-1045(+)
MSLSSTKPHSVFHTQVGTSYCTGQFLRSCGKSAVKSPRFRLSKFRSPRPMSALFAASTGKSAAMALDTSLTMSAGGSPHACICKARKQPSESDNAKNYIYCGASCCGLLEVQQTCKTIAVVHYSADALSRARD